MDKNILSFAVTKIGNNHLKINKVCEDASDNYDDEYAHICVVADGHGSDNYPRTDRGSKYAVDAAIKCIREFVKNAIPEQVHNEKRDHYPLLRLLAASILWEWYQSVEEDYKRDALDSSELENVSEKYRNRYLSGEKLEKAYGTTLIAFVVSEKYSFGLQIGDGKCVAVDQKGEFFEPIPLHEACQLNVTTSICDSDAIDEFQFCVLSEVPAAVFCGTDGIDDSYSDTEELYALYRSILCIIAEHGVEIGKNEIEEYLPILTKRGSGDDVSIASIIDVEGVNKLAPLFNVQSELFKLRNELNVKTRKLDSNNEKIRVLAEKKKKYIEDGKSVEDIEKDIMDFTDESKIYNEEIEATESKLSEINSRYDMMLNNKSAELSDAEQQSIEIEDKTDEVTNIDYDNNPEETVDEVSRMQEAISQTSDVEAEISE